jgi:hypothetical protein
MYAAAPAIAVILSLVAAGCGNGGASDRADAAPPADAGPPPDASARCLEANEHDDLEWLQDNVFTPSCSAFASCHKGAAASAGRLNLEAGNTADNLIDQPAGSDPAMREGWTLVVPGDPAQSYMMVLVDHVSKGGRFEGPLPQAGTMPYNSSLLCLEKRQAIERWIESLAN